MYEETRVVAWLESGNERCPHCLTLYWHETGYRCTGCDGPICAHCIEIETAGSACLCPGCPSDEQA